MARTGPWRTAVTNKTWSFGFFAVAAAFAFLTATAHVASVDTALANDQCAKQCYTQENACRKAKAGDPSCDAELTKCLQGCRGK